MPTMKIIHQMLNEDKEDFTQAIQEKFRTQYELQMIATNLKTTILVIATLGDSYHSYTPDVYKTINRLANMLSTGVIDNDAPINPISAASTDALTSIISIPVLEIIGMAPMMHNLSNDKHYNAIYNLQRIHVETLKAFRNIKTRTNLLNISVNLMLNLDLIAHMASRHNAMTPDSMAIIAKVANIIAKSNPIYDISEVSNVKYIINQLSPKDINFITSKPNVKVLLSNNKFDFNITKCFSTGDFFMIDHNGFAILNGSPANNVAKVQFNDGRLAVQFSFDTMMVYLMYNGDIFLSKHRKYFS